MNLAGLLSVFSPTWSQVVSAISGLVKLLTHEVLLSRSFSSLFPPICSHLSLLPSTVPSHQNTMFIRPSLSVHAMIISWHRVQDTLSTANIEHSIHWVWHTQRTAYTKYFIHRVLHTTSTCYTEYCIHRVPYTPSTALTNYCIIQRLSVPTFHAVSNLVGIGGPCGLQHSTLTPKWVHQFIESASLAPPTLTSASWLTTSKVSSHAN